MEAGNHHYAYMLRCKDNSIYSGYTTDLDRRLEVHNSGKGAKYTRARLPVKLEYFEEFEDKKEALKREREFKKYTHTEKEKIIKNSNNYKGGVIMDREKAARLLKKYNKEEFHIRHAITVEQVMRYFAKSLGYDEEFWGIVRTIT